MMSPTDKREWQAYLELKKRIGNATEPIKDESEAAKQKRIKGLLKTPAKFFKYYFPHYMDADFGWFHRKAIREIEKNDNIFLVLEWAREHAKSVFADVMLPMWLLASGRLTGMILGSSTELKAKGLLKDIQAELEQNRRFTHDYGSQRPVGGWADGHFTTTGGIGFWSFGVGQNPAGVREAEKRPNYGVLDDADDKRKAKNQERVKEDVDWFLGEFLGCLSIKGAIKVYANNRVHRAGLTAHVVGDIEEKDPKREGITHIKVFATEHPRTHAMLMPDAGGVPAWKERYTLPMITRRMGEMGWRNSMRQFYHKHEEEGYIFTADMIKWVKPLNINKYDHLISYNDPSWKGTKKNDFKAIVLIGKTGIYYDILWAWVRQAQSTAMVDAHYLLNEITHQQSVPHWIEANLMQEQHLENYKLKGEETGIMMRIRPDKRKKPDKYDRIADLEPLFNMGLIRFNEKFRQDSDMITLVNQFIGFPHGFDDGPDAVEGGIYLVNKRNKASKFKARMGKLKTSNRKA